MPNGGPHDPVRMRDNRRFLVIVAVLLGLVVLSVLWLSIDKGTLGRPATWMTLGVPLALLVLAIRARLRTWPPEAGRVDEFTSWAGLRPTRHLVSGSFGDRLQEYASPTLAVRVIRDRGQWSLDVSDREGRPDAWYDAALLRDLLGGGGNDVLTFPEQVAVVEQGWKEIAERFAADRREETHARLAALREQRARPLLLDPLTTAPANLADRRVTPGWRLLYIGVEGVVDAMGGIDPWKHRWRSLPSVKVVVPHPSHPTQRHEFRVYEFDGPSGPVQLAAGEFSNGVWGIFVPESNESSDNRSVPPMRGAFSIMALLLLSACGDKGGSVSASDPTAVRELFKAIRSGELAQVRAMLDADPALVRACAQPPPMKDDGQSPLQVALKTGKRAIAELLLDRGADVNFMESSTLSEWRMPVLHDAIIAAIESTTWLDLEPSEAHRAIAIVGRMLEMGANPNSVDSLGIHCLVRAVIDVERVSGTNPSTYESRQPLIQQLFALLLKHGADTTRGPLHGSAEHYARGKAAFRFLIAGTPSGHVEPALCAAIRKHDRAGAERIIEADPSVLRRRDAAGRTPLMIAVVFGDLELVRSMLDQGALAQDAEANAHGWPVLSLGLWSPPITRLLLERGANANAADKDGWTALGRVLMWGATDAWRKATVATLLEFGASLDTTTPEGRPLRALRDAFEARLGADR